MGGWFWAFPVKGFGAVSRSGWAGGSGRSWLENSPPDMWGRQVGGAGRWTKRDDKRRAIRATGVGDGGGGACFKTLEAVRSP